MRSQSSRALRGIARGVATQLGIPPVNWTAKEHTVEREFETITTQEDGTDIRTLETRNVKVYQIVLGNCARKLYRDMKRRVRFGISSTGQDPKPVKGKGGYRGRIKRKQQRQVSHFRANSAESL